MTESSAVIIPELSAEIVFESSATIVPESTSVCFRCKNMLNPGRWLINKANAYCSDKCVLASTIEHVQSPNKENKNLEKSKVIQPEIQFITEEQQPFSGKASEGGQQIQFTVEERKSMADLSIRRYKALSARGRMSGGQYTVNITIEQLEELKAVLYAEGCADILDGGDTRFLLDKYEISVRAEQEERRIAEINLIT